MKRRRGMLIAALAVLGALVVLVLVFPVGMRWAFMRESTTRPQPGSFAVTVWCESSPSLQALEKASRVVLTSVNESAMDQASIESHFGPAFERVEFRQNSATNLQRVADECHRNLVAASLSLESWRVFVMDDSGRVYEPRPGE